MPDVINEISRDYQNNRIDGSLTAADVYSMNGNDKPSNQIPNNNCSADQINQYVKDRILPACSIEGTVQENLANGNLNGLKNALGALSIKEEERVKAIETAHPKPDPEGELKKSLGIDSSAKKSA